MTTTRADSSEATRLPAGRRAVLYAVRRRGEATAEQVAEQLDITVSGARQHLNALARDGLVESTELPS
jgi:DeoR family transcriptional regulator, suf operon transcriptional repressor